MFKPTINLRKQCPNCKGNNIQKNPGSKLPGFIHVECQNPSCRYGWYIDERRDLK